MLQYTQICRAAAVLLLLSTGLLAVAVIGVALLAVFGLTILQQVFAEGEQIIPFSLVVWIAAAFVVPSLLLVWFYIVVLSKVPSRAAATAGWVASAAFYLGLTILFVTLLSGRIETSHSLLSMPLWIYTAFATAVSVYLAMACRRSVAAQPPPMPVVR